MSWSSLIVVILVDNLLQDDTSFLMENYCCALTNRELHGTPLISSSSFYKSQCTPLRQPISLNLSHGDCISSMQTALRPSVISSILIKGPFGSDFMETIRLAREPGKGFVYHVPRGSYQYQYCWKLRKQNLGHYKYYVSGFGQTITFRLVLK